YVKFNGKLPGWSDHIYNHLVQREQILEYLNKHLGTKALDLIAQMASDLNGTSKTVHILGLPKIERLGGYEFVLIDAVMLEEGL
ncbi:42009_t:CDS:2, partial [Gigaspora margarita]